MSDVRLYVHAVWAVKHRYPLLEPSLQPILFKHIEEYSVSRGIEILALNGHTDHLHALLRIKGVQSVSTIIQLIKGESSKWANQEMLFEKKLAWAVGYYARSVEPKKLKVVKNYISNQDKRHTSLEITSYLSKLDTDVHEPNKMNQ